MILEKIIVFLLVLSHCQLRILGSSSSFFRISYSACRVKYPIGEQFQAIIDQEPDQRITSYKQRPWLVSWRFFAQLPEHRL